LAGIDGIKRASRDWAANGKAPHWLVYSGAHLTRVIVGLRDRPDLRANLDRADREYDTACDKAHRRIYGILGGVVRACWPGPLWIDWCGSSSKASLSDALIDVFALLLTCREDACSLKAKQTAGRYSGFCSITGPKRSKPFLHLKQIGRSFIGPSPCAQGVLVGLLQRHNRAGSPS
jgi:hypothetical protein